MSKQFNGGNGIKIVDRRTGDEHQHRFARSSREAFGSDFDIDDEPMGEDTPTGAVVLWLVVVFAMIVLVIYHFAAAETVYEQGPDQQKVVIEQHYMRGEMR